MRLLIADDVEAHRFLLSETLADFGDDVCEAASGEQALAMVASTRPEVVLLDVEMPGIDGIETSRRIKELPGPFTYVILLSGYPEVAGSRDFERSRADRFLGKPYTLADVREAVGEGRRVAGGRRIAE